MSDAQVPEWLGRLADANKRIAELERIVGKQEEELHQRELDLADVLKKREQAEALAKQRLDVQHDINKQYLGEQIARQQAEAELAALKSAELSEHRLAREEAEQELAALKGRRWDCGIPSCGAYPKARAEEGGE